MGYFYSASKLEFLDSFFPPLDYFIVKTILLALLGFCSESLTLTLLGESLNLVYRKTVEYVNLNHFKLRSELWDCNLEFRLNWISDTCRIKLLRHVLYTVLVLPLTSMLVCRVYPPRMSNSIHQFLFKSYLTPILYYLDKAQTWICNNHW